MLTSSQPIHVWIVSDQVLYEVYENVLESDSETLTYFFNEHNKYNMWDVYLV